MTIHSGVELSRFHVTVAILGASASASPDVLAVGAVGALAGTQGPPGAPGSHRQPQKQDMQLTPFWRGRRRMAEADGGGTGSGA